LAAKQRGLPRLDRLRALRAEFGLSLAAAKAVLDATDGRPRLFPEVASAEQLEAVLTSELGYCGCASTAALVVLRDLLRAAEARTDATGDTAVFSQASRRLEVLLAEGGGWAEWVVYGLEQREFVWHGFRQADLWVSERGRLLLRALESFGPDEPPAAVPLTRPTDAKQDEGLGAV
jgi:hypothetical protein